MWNRLSTWWENLLLTIIIIIGVVMVLVFMVFVTVMMLVLLPLQSAGIVDNTEVIIEKAYPFIWLTMLALLSWLAWSVIR